MECVNFGIEMTEMGFLKMQPEYGLEVYKYCAKLFLKMENMKERKNTKPALFKNNFQKYVRNDCPLELYQHSWLQRKVLEKKNNSGAHTKQLEKYGYRIRIQPLMDFIRSVDDSKRARKMCSVKIDNCLHCTDRPGPCPLTPTFL